MPRPSHMCSEPALCRSPQRFFENPAGWFAHLTTPNFRPSNQTTIDSLRNRLADEIPLDRAGLETRVCECYAIVRNELGRLLSDAQYRQGIPAASASRIQSAASAG